jgi:hypothetical protein
LKRQIHTSLVALLLCGTVGPLLAQEQAKPGRFHVGPFYLTPRLELRNAGVDTNVYNSLAAPVPDTAIVLRPSLRAFMPIGRRIRIEGTGYLDFNYFRREFDERSTDYGGEGSVEIDVSRFTLFGFGGGLQARQRATIDLDERLLRQEHFGGGGVTMRVGQRTELGARAEKRQLRHAPSRTQGAAVQVNADRDSLTAGGQIRVGITALTTLIGQGEVIEDTFVHQRDGSRLTRSYRYLAGAEFGRAALLQGTLLGGLRHIPSDTAGSVREYKGPVLRVLVTLPIRSTVRLNAMAERDVFFAVTADRDASSRDSYISERLEGGMDVNMPLDLVARATAGVQRADYLQPTFFAGQAFDEVHHAYSLSGSLLRAISDTSRIGVIVSWTRRVSTRPGHSYEGWRYGLTADITP